MNNNKQEENEIIVLKYQAAKSALCIADCVFTAVP